MSRRTCAPDTYNRHHIQCIVCDTVRLAARLACTSTSHRHPTAAVGSYAYHLPPYGCTSRPSAARLAATAPSCTAAMAADLLLAVLPALSSNAIASEQKLLQEVLESRSPPSSSRHVVTATMPCHPVAPLSCAAQSRAHHHADAKLTTTTRAAAVSDWLPTSRWQQPRSCFLSPVPSACLRACQKLWPGVLQWFAGQTVSRSH